MQRGGLKWGDDLFLNSINVTYPFAKIEVFPNKIMFKVNVLGVYRKEINLDKSDIIKIKLKRYVLNKGFLFSHNNLKTAPILIFWSFASKELMENLINMGYEDVIDTKQMGGG